MKKALLFLVAVVALSTSVALVLGNTAFLACGDDCDDCGGGTCPNPHPRPHATLACGDDCDDCGGGTCPNPHPRPHVA